MSSEDKEIIEEVKLTPHDLTRKQCACGWAVYARTEAAAIACLLDHQERYHNKLGTVASNDGGDVPQ